MQFTTENAAMFGAKGGIASGKSKEQAAIDRRDAIALANFTAGYEGKTLARVRLQLDEVFGAFMAEVAKQCPDASKLDRLAAAQSRLHEQERQLSNRPLPGTLRPNSPQKRVKNEAPQPIESNDIPPP